MDFHDIGNKYLPDGMKYVWFDIRDQWPSGPLQPANGATPTTSGIDCLAILYRHIQSMLKGDRCPSPEELHLDANNAPINKVHQFFWADFDAPRRLQQHVALVSSRDKALVPLVESVPSQFEDKHSFEALNSSTAMGSILWTFEAFLFYKSVFVREPGTNHWVQKYTKYQSNEQRAVLSRLEWKISRPEDTLQHFITESEVVGGLSEKWIIGFPLVIQVRFTVPSPAVKALTICDLLTFKVNILPDVNVVGTQGNMETFEWQKPKPTVYNLMAAFRLRNRENPLDSIRLYGELGNEVLPMCNRGIPPAQKHTWAFKVDENLPEGQSFIFFYREMEDGGYIEPRDSVDRGLSVADMHHLINLQLQHNTIAMLGDPFRERMRVVHPEPGIPSREPIIWSSTQTSNVQAHNRSAAMGLSGQNEAATSNAGRHTAQ